MPALSAASFGDQTDPSLWSLSDVHAALGRSTAELTLAVPHAVTIVNTDEQNRVRTERRWSDG